MSGGAAAAAPRICKEAGCGRPARGRGMCNSHWKKWADANPGVRMEPTTQRTIEEALPGHIAQLVEATGYCHATVRRTLDILKAKDLAHIGHFDPPTTLGTKFKPVWVQGPGKDAVLTKKKRHEQECKSNRQSYARRKKGWAAALGVG